jgi:2-polyprenyl-3-methyl-5-hydroxy-6-metoxy-1,4-benzoquinol methylase
MLMPDDATLQQFLAASPYTDPVDIKKLRFVHRSIASFASGGMRPAGELDILEVACGVGGITLALASLGARVRALDLDVEDVKALERGAERLGFDNIEVTIEDAFGFNDGNCYDIVVASEVFEHVLEPEGLADVIARHTRPGGLLIVTTPNGYGPWETWNSLNLLPRRWNWLRRLAGKPPHGARRGREHEQRYTKRGLLGLFEARGYELSSFSNSDFIFTISRPLRRSGFFGNIDVKLGDLVPHWMASGWYLAFRLKQNNGGPSQ